MPPLNSHLIYGYFYENDGSTGFASVPIYLINNTKGGLIQTTTNALGRYIFDCANFDDYDNRDDLIVIGLTRIYTRRIISSLTILDSADYRFTITLGYSDDSIGTGLVVDAGLNLVRDWSGNVSTTVPTHMEWSDGTGALAAGDTSLDGSNKQRNAFTSIVRDTTTSVSYKATLTTAQLDGVDITKSGSFNASSTGALFYEILYGAISKTTLFNIIEIDQVKITS